MTDRKTRLKAEIESLLALCDLHSFMNVRDVSEESLVLSLSHKSLFADYIFNFCDDYPEGTFVCNSNGDVVKIPRGRATLATIVAGITEDWCVGAGVPVPDLSALLVDAPEPLSTQVSVASSEYTSEGDFDGDEDDYYDGYGELGAGDALNPVLEEEIQRIKNIFGDNAVEERMHAGIDEMDVFLNIDLNNYLDVHTAEAWGVKLVEPLVILMHIRSVSKYLEWLEPQVDVFQAPPDSRTDKRKVGIGSQMRKIMERFVNEQWRSISSSAMEEMLLKKSDGDTKSLKDMDVEAPVSRDRTGLATSTSDFGRQHSLGAQVGGVEQEEDLEADKKIPSLENGFLAQCMQYALNRVRSLNEFCVICDEIHVIESGLIKPCVCTRELCVFAFQTLGVMTDAADAIATDANVVDLLIAMANAAAASQRAVDILDPYPSVVDPVCSTRLALDPKSKDFVLVKTVMEHVVASRNRMLKGHANLKVDLDKQHRLSFPLMQWIIATCRAHIVLLPEDKQLKSLKTNYQFILVSSPPVKEAAFRNAKEKNGSTFAFHGSNIENWHSIMRKGLLNASGTKYQLHGAAYGKGIYLSPMSSVSFGYSNRYVGKPKPKPGVSGVKESLAGRTNIRCIALCEVVTSKDLRRSGDIWVCPNSDHVCTRFFFVYDEYADGSVTADNTDTRTQKFKQEIDHAMSHVGAFKMKNRRK